MVLKFAFLIAAIALSSRCVLYLDDGYWTDWSDCRFDGEPVTCGVNGSITTRYKICPKIYNSSEVVNATCSKFDATCAQVPCYDPFETSVWSDCSAECGGGLRQRIGQYENGAEAIQIINCNSHVCKNNTNQDISCNGTDLVVMVDSSSSIGELVWPVIKQFLIDLVKALDISKNGNRMSLITYSTHINTIFHLNNNFTSEEYEQLIWNSDYMAGSMATAEGLMRLRQEIRKNAIPTRPHIGLIITDAGSNILSDLVTPVSSNIKNDGTFIIGIGVGDYNKPEMENIVSKPTNYSLFEIDQANTLNQVVEIVGMKVCNASILRPCEPCAYSGCSASECNTFGQMTGISSCHDIDPVTMVISNIRNVTCAPKFCFKTCTDGPSTTTAISETTPLPEEPDCFRCDFTNGQIWRPNYLNCHEYFVCEPPHTDGVYKYTCNM